MSPTICIGIDVSPGRPPFTLAALDDERRLAALSHGPLAEMLAYTAGQSTAVVAISAPARPNSGFATAQELLPSEERPLSLSGARQRLAEQSLIELGYSIPRTPARAEDCPAWMQRGFTFYDRLQAAGYELFPAQAPRLWFETHSEACYHSLLGRPPFQAGTLEGRLQRQLVLRDLKLPVSDAMNFFEEVTRYKLLHGILPTRDLFNQNELNALMAAHMAWLAVHSPDKLAAYGDTQEGLIYLPVVHQPEED